MLGVFACDDTSRLRIHHQQIHPNDIIKQYEEDIAADPRDQNTSPLVRAVEQVFGYLAEGRLQFGALSTYINTWFLQRPKDTPDRLRISNGILSYATDPSFLQSYAYVISLAMKNPESPSPIASPMQTHQKPFIDDSSDYSSDHTDRTYLPSSSYQTSSTEKTSGTSMNLRARQSQALQHSNWDTFHLWM